MKTTDAYYKWVAWSEEDGVYLGKCPDLISGIPGDDPVILYAELTQLVAEVIDHFEETGTHCRRPPCGRCGRWDDRRANKGFRRQKPMRFTVTLEREEDGGFVAIVPALPGCDVVQAVEGASAGRRAGTGG